MASARVGFSLLSLHRAVKRSCKLSLKDVVKDIKDGDRAAAGEKKSEQMMGMKGWRLGQSLQKFQFGRVPLLDGLGA